MSVNLTALFHYILRNTINKISFKSPLASEIISKSVIVIVRIVPKKYKKIIFSCSEEDSAAGNDIFAAESWEGPVRLPQSPLVEYINICSL